MFQLAPAALSAGIGPSPLPFPPQFDHEDEHLCPPYKWHEPWCCGAVVKAHWGPAPLPHWSSALWAAGRSTIGTKMQNTLFSLQSRGLAGDPPPRSQWLKDAEDFPAAKDHRSRLDALQEWHIWILSLVSGRELAAPRLCGGLER